jgi:alpha-1,2-mannosyltransferase
VTTINGHARIHAAHLADALRRGDFLTRERARLVAGAVLAFSILVLGFLAVTSTGSVDIVGRPLGTDFSSFYAAGSAVLDGAPATPYDPAAHHARQKEIFGPDTPFYGWQYPPFFLALVTPLALLPYPFALVIWQGITLLLYLWTIRAIVAAHGPRMEAAKAPDRLWLLLALGFPAVFVNLGHGQNGFLSAALIGAALLQLDRRPVLAGVLFGLLAYKPQLGVVIPFVLIATGRWKTFLAAAATVAALVLTTLVLFGPEVWRAFLASTGFTREALLEAGDPGWEKIQSVFAWVRLWGGSEGLAYAVQIATTIAVVVALAWLWRSTASHASKAAALALAVILGAPFSIDYDMTVLAVAIAFLAMDGSRRGFAPYEKSLLAALWLVPLVARSMAGATSVPIGIIVMGAAFAFLVYRISADRRMQHAPPT